MTDNYAELRAALTALSAETESRNGVPWFDARQVLHQEITGEFDIDLCQLPETDMAYIAAANPETIRALLAERDAIASEVETLRSHNALLRASIAQVEAENDRLREALEEIAIVGGEGTSGQAQDAVEAAMSAVLAESGAGVYYMDPPDGGGVLASEQVRRMAEDAARYRWLRSPDNPHGPSLVAFCKPDELDAAIDAAIAAGSPLREGGDS